MKRLVLYLMVTLCILLVGCVKKLDPNPNDLRLEISKLVINTDVLFVNQMDSREEVKYDRVEMLDARNREAILIHIIQSGVHYPSEDYRILITPEWIYSTKTMTKVENTYDLADDEEFKSVVEAYTSMIELELFTPTTLIQLMNNGQDHEFFRVRQEHTIRFRTPSAGDILPNEKTTMEYIYTNHILQEIHYRHIKDQPSTKQQSNYISGTHYFFLEEIDIEPVDISDFS